MRDKASNTVHKCRSYMALTWLPKALVLIAEFENVQIDLDAQYAQRQKFEDDFYDVTAIAKLLV